MTLSAKLGLIVYFDSKAWIGGTNYIKNIILALAGLPAHKRPGVKLLVQPAYIDDIAHYQSVLPMVESVEVFHPDLQPDVDILFPAVGNLPQDRRYTKVGWIFDLQHKALPAFFSKNEIAERDKSFQRKCTESDLLVLSSKAVLQDLSKHFAVACPTFVLPFCSTAEANWFSGDPTAVAAKYGLSGEYLMCCNQFWQHKDHETLFKALAHFKLLKKQLPLVCTGSTDDYRNPAYFPQLLKKITELGLEDQIKILGLIDRYDQIQLLRGALAVVQPSLFEGWSTVMEDARLLGKTIIYSDIPVHLEQNPPYGFSFKAGDVRSLARAFGDAAGLFGATAGSVREKEAAQAAEERRMSFGINIVKMMEAALSATGASGCARAAPSQIEGKDMLPKLHFCSAENKNTIFRYSGTQWYAPQHAGASTIVKALFTTEVYNSVLDIFAKLDPDDYLLFMMHYMKNGLKLYGQYWCYADICTVLYALAKMLRPEDYLEIGVRRGRSLSMVAAQHPTLRITACDMWAAGYAGMDNPGPQFIVSQLEKLGASGEITFLSGDSHQLLPEHFAARPEQSYDLITVDGDHSPAGATADLVTVLPRLRIGGAIVFDDIAHPAHPALMEVWRRTVKSQSCMSCYEFTELGYGVAFGIRMY